MTKTSSRSLNERIFHAFTYEVISIISMTVIGFYILNKPADSMGLLSILISTTAMIFNVIFNWVFDKLFPFVNGDRPIKLRVLHAAGFECMMILFTLPMISYLLKVMEERLMVILRKI